jgi:hypothetical protein
MKRILAIDPGAKGAIAYENEERLHYHHMPESITELYDILMNICLKEQIDLIVVEKTGTYVPGNSATAAVKFARHCGVLDIIPYALGVSSTYISPMKWMKYFNPPKDKKERKTYLWEKAKLAYPNSRITKQAGDAVALLLFSRSNL